MFFLAPANQKSKTGTTCKFIAHCFASLVEETVFCTFSKF